MFGWYILFNIISGASAIPAPVMELAEMFQIRSDHRWAQGFFKLKPKSVVTFRYRVRTAGEGQFTVCVRTERLGKSETGVVEWNGRYELPGPDGWQTVSVRAEDMLDNRRGGVPRAECPSGLSVH